MRLIADACDRAASGDYEVRVPALFGGDEAVAARTAINRLLDVTDAYVRESAAALTAAAQGRFHRRFLERGMTGAFNQGAKIINTATHAMCEGAQRLAQLESAVGAAAGQVATAATEMGGAAEMLAVAARSAAGEAEQAQVTVGSLRAASGQIRHAVDMINRMALQTQMLALNATIEAAHAGRAGRGFSVVATEVRHLADEAAKASDAIVDQVVNVQDAAKNTITVLDTLVARVQSMDGLVQNITVAVHGVHDDENTKAGLTELAKVLDAEVGRFAEVVRSG